MILLPTNYKGHLPQKIIIEREVNVTRLFLFVFICFKQMSELINFLQNTPYPDNTSVPPESESEIKSYGNRPIDGVSYGEYKTNDRVIIVDNTQEDLWSEKYHELIDKEFPNAPFSICLNNDELLKLDEPFTAEKSIIIMDERAHPINHGCNFTQSELYDFVASSYLLVQKKGDNPITLRHILNAMINNDDYKLMNKKESQYFLEAFYKITPIHYGARFGS